MRISIIATLVAGAFLSLNAHATDLLQVYQEALANDPQYASARAAHLAGDEAVAQGRAGLLPNVTANGSRTRNNTDYSIDGSPSASTSYSASNYGIQLTQPLFRWANWEQYQQSKLQTAASEAQFAQAQQDLILRVAQAYFDVLTAQDALTTLQAEKVAIGQQLSSARRNFEVGTATITDTHEAQSRYDLAVAQELAAQSDLEIKHNTLQQIIGKQPGALADLRPGVELTAPSPANIDDWVQSAHKQNYGVVAQQFAREIAQRNIGLNRAGHLPTVDLIASRNHAYQGPGANPAIPGSYSTNNTAVGVQVSIPLFSGGGTSSRVRQAIANSDKAAADLETAKRAAEQNARQAYLGVTSGLAQVKAYEAAEVSSKSSLESNRLGYQVGVRINIDVLNAQQQLYSTQQSLAKARYDTLINGLRLKAAAGTLKEDDVVQLNGLLQH